MMARKEWRRLWKLPLSAALGLLVLLSARGASSYSVLTHEATIDSTWRVSAALGAPLAR
jgi:hypothetical protein